MRKLNHNKLKPKGINANPDKGTVFARSEEEVK